MARGEVGESCPGNTVSFFLSGCPCFAVCFFRENLRTRYAIVRRFRVFSMFSICHCDEVWGLGLRAWGLKFGVWVSMMFIGLVFFLSLFLCLSSCPHFSKPHHKTPHPGPKSINLNLSAPHLRPRTQEGSIWTDFLFSTILFPCTVCQLYRQVKFKPLAGPNVGHTPNSAPYIHTLETPNQSAPCETE